MTIIDNSLFEHMGLYTTSDVLEHAKGTAEFSFHWFLSFMPLLLAVVKADGLF